MRADYDTPPAPPAPPQPEPPRRRPFPLRAARVLLRLLAGLLGLTAALIAGALLFIQTDFFRERARLFALERLREVVHGRVEVARLGGDLLRGVTLDGVSITSPDGEPFLEIERLKVSYEIGGLLDEKIVVGDARLVRPRIRLVQDPSGEWNYLKIMPFLRGGEEPERPGGWGSLIRVDELEIVDGTVALITRREAQTFGPLGTAPEMTGLNGILELEFSSLEEDRKRFAARDLSFRVAAIPPGEREPMADTSSALTRSAAEEADRRRAAGAPALDVRELDAEAVLTPRGMDVDRFLLRTSVSEIAGSGTIRNLAAPIFDLKFQASPVALEELRRFVPDIPFEGTVRGVVGLSGPGFDLELTLEDFELRTPASRVLGKGVITTEKGPVVNAELTFDPLAPADARVLWRGYPLEEPLRGRLSVKGSRGRLAIGGDLTFDGTEAAVSGTISLPGRQPAYDLAFTLERMDLEKVLHAPAWRSVVNGDFRLRGRGLGTQADASFSGSLRDSRLLFYDVRAGTFSGRFRPGSPGAFDVDSFTLALPRSRVWGSGTMPYDYSLDFELRAVSGNLQDFYPGIGTMPAARFEGQGRLAGPYAGLDLSMTATADSLAWNGLVADSLSGEALFDDLGKPTFQMTMQGSGTSVDYLGPIAFQDAQFKLGFSQDTMGVDVQARMDSLRSAEGHLAIDFSGPRPRLLLDRGTLTVGPEVFAVEEPSGFEYQAGVFTFNDFALVHEDERVAIDGTLRVDGPQDFSVRVEQMGLDHFMTLAGTHGPVAAVLNGSARVTGTDLSPVIRGEFALQEGRLGGVAVHELAGRIDYAERSLGLDLRVVPETALSDSTGDTGEVRVSGTFPVDLAFGPVARRIPDDPIDLRLESRGLTLTLLQSLFPRIADASGPLELNVHLTGRPSDPLYTGELTVRDGTVRVRGGQRYSGITGTARFDNDQVTFENVGVSSATGRAELTGRIAIRELTLGDIEARISARRFTLIDQEGKTLVVDAQMELGGTTHAPSITGRMNVEEGEWPLPERTDKDVIDLDEAIIYVRAEGDTSQPSEPAPGVWRETLLDLDVSIEDDLILRSDKAFFVLQGEVTIDKERGQELPLVAGSLEVVRGYYSDFGMTFEIDEGEVFFYGTPELNPGLHIAARQTVENAETGQEVELTLTIGGTLRNPTLNVASNPEYDKSEIFSLMLFGTPTPAQGQQSQFESTITRVATRQAALPLQRALVQELGLDLLEIQPGFGGREGTRVRVGKYISPDVFVTYTQSTGGPRRDESLFSVQYRLSRKWTVETHAGTRQFGADIFYEFQY